MNRLRTKHSPVSFAEQSVSKERKRELYPIAERNGKVMSPKNGKTNSGQSYAGIEAGTERSRPILHQKAREIQPYNKIAKLPIGLDEEVCADSVENLNQLLADTITLRDMYKKHHWQVAGHTFYQLHLLFDKHHGEQDELVDSIAERIQLRRRNHPDPEAAARTRRSPCANLAPARSS
jgi:hypothetical protein